MKLPIGTGCDGANKHIEQMRCAHSSCARR